MTVSLRRGRRVVEVVRGLARDLLPHSRGVVVVSCRASLRGRFTAVVRIAAQPGWKAGPLAPRLPGATRALRLRL